jgi:hypothetical protein
MAPGPPENLSPTGQGKRERTCAVEGNMHRLNSPRPFRVQADTVKRPKRHFARCACGNRFLTFTRRLCDACDYERHLQA